MYVCWSPQKEPFYIYLGKNIRSSSTGLHEDGRTTYSGVLPGSPRGSLTALLSLPQCRAALGTIPSTLAWVDQSPVSQRVFATPIRVYLLAPWCRVLLEKLTGLQLVKKFPAFHGTPRFITALTSVRNLSLSWASPIQSIYPHPTSWRSVLILSTHLRLGLPSDLFPSGFPTKNLYTPSPQPPSGYTLHNCYRLPRDPG